MDDGHSDDLTEEFDPFAGAEPREDEAFPTSPESDPWPGAGARRSPRPPAEGVRIIGAEEAAAAIESGQATRRSSGDAPRFGDVPEPPPEPRPPLRFPGADPTAVGKPPIATPSVTPPSRPTDGGDHPDPRDSYVEESFWDEPAETPAEPAPTWSAGEGWALGPSGPSERAYGGPSDSSERADATSSGSSEWAGARPPDPSERVGARLSGRSQDVGGSAGGPSERFGDDRSMSRPVSGGMAGDRFEPGSTFDAGPRGERPVDPGSEPEGERYAGLPGESEEYEYEPFFAPPAEPADQGPSGPAERGTQGPSGPAERGAQGPIGPAERGTQGPGTGSGPALPHWTEPPSGEHPRIRSDPDPDADPDDDLKAWSTLSTGPRWRDQPTDWEEADFGGAAVLDDPEMRLGALRTELPEEDQDFGLGDQASVLPEAAPPARARRARGGAPHPGGPPMPPGAPPPPRRSRRLDPRGRSAPGGARKREGLHPGVGDPTGAPPMGAGGGFDMRGRELQVRVVTGAVVLGVVLVAAALGPGALAFVVAVVLTMAVAELYQAVRTHGYHPATLLGLAATVGLVAVAYWRPLDWQSYLLVPVLLMIFSFLWFLAGVSKAPPIANIGVTLLGFMYVGVLGSFAAVILGLGENGVGVLLGAVLATAAYDTGAYFVGAWAGRTPLMPHISPGKTVEGVVGGTFATLVMCIIFVRLIHPWDGGTAFWLFVVVSVAAPLGDLCESMIKRELGVKDMGALVPGHGGVLDRIDALLFVIPATWYLLTVLT